MAQKSALRTLSRRKWLLASAAALALGASGPALADTKKFDIAPQPLLRAWLAGLKLPGPARLQIDIDPYSFL